jgi:hypothetical protein
MYSLWKSCKTTACEWSCPSLCVFSVRKYRILSQIHVLVFVTEHVIPITLHIYIRCIFCKKVVRQQHVTGVANHFVFSLCGNAVSCLRYMFWWLWLNMRLQLHCKNIFNVIYAKSWKATACDWGCQSLCVFTTMRKCHISSQIHVLVFVTEHETRVTLQIYIRCIFCKNFVRQQHVTGVASHFVFLLCGNAVSFHRNMFWCLWLNMRFQLHCIYILDVFFAKKFTYPATDTCSGVCDWTLDSSYIANKY